MRLLLLSTACLDKQGAHSFNPSVHFRRHHVWLTEPAMLSYLFKRTVSSDPFEKYSCIFLSLFNWHNIWTIAYSITYLEYMPLEGTLFVAPFFMQSEKYQLFTIIHYNCFKLPHVVFSHIQYLVSFLIPQQWVPQSPCYPSIVQRYKSR